MCIRDSDKAIYPLSAAGVPFTAAYIQSKGDPITDLHENMAAEQKARSTYEYLINMADDPDVIAVSYTHLDVYKRQI